MTVADCDEMALLIQADIDGELQPAEAARVAAHAGRCPTCTETQRQLLALSQRIRSEATRHAAPAALHAAVRAATALPRRRVVRWPDALVPGLSFGGGFAVACGLAAFLVLHPGIPPGIGGLPDDVVAAHIRALQPGHLMDVVSTDEHTVKPWFDGRLPFAPPVKDLAAIGFPLIGGRLDYFAGRTAAALIYRSDRHAIDLFAWPAPPEATGSGARDGYNYQRWSQNGMSFWAVSDLNAQELAGFVRRWQAN